MKRFRKSVTESGASDTKQAAKDLKKHGYPALADLISPPPPSLPNRSEKESEKAICVICGNPMPKGEEMFKFHGYSGDCPPKKEGWKAPPTEKEIEREQIRHQYAEELKDGVNKLETHWDEGCDIETVSKSDVLSLLERKGEK